MFLLNNPKRVADKVFLGFVVTSKKAYDTKYKADTEPENVIAKGDFHGGSDSGRNSMRKEFMGTSG
ncbi:MAG: hypothetical protein A2V81_00775 [Candidatus Abawacabacteria bacterium RBG_16_42_10]|uniref:Uncharacterized protein n=1 Tax=Candidatus Abawacabacteria bacterium RBG_16_42_10 TaxID=1817814 RepID=A0A1F4XIA1_9BACT|nr:MAG: hypothetical protein A2V81_00775 [Candidatus Abawacabacteria bacterium RBG_16_42_10]